MNTDEIMRLALRMARFSSIPGDSGVWVTGERIRKVLFCVDAGPPELILAKDLGYDLVIAHHPVGPAELTYSEVVWRHVDFMTAKGVPKDIAEKATKELVRRIDVRAHPKNYMHDVEVAEKLKMPFMNIHLPIDQITRDYLLKAIEKSKSKTLGELVDKLSKVPEFRKAKTKIELRMGNKNDPVGNWVLVFAAGTNGGYPVASVYFENGVDTVIYLHVDYDELVKLEKESRGNLIVLGHIAGDSIGINLFIRRLRAKGVHVDTLGVVH